MAPQWTLGNVVAPKHWSIGNSEGFLAQQPQWKAQPQQLSCIVTSASAAKKSGVLVERAQLTSCRLTHLIGTID
jgi:hypothetical protein